MQQALDLKHENLMAPFLVDSLSSQTNKKKKKMTQKGWTVRDINLGHSNPTQPSVSFV